MDNKKDFRICSNQEVKYVYVISGVEAMAMVVYITGGRKVAIMPSIIIFTNQMQNYPICRIEDNMPGNHLFFLCMNCMSMLNIYWQY